MTFEAVPDEQKIQLKKNSNNKIRTKLRLNSYWQMHATIIPLHCKYEYCIFSRIKRRGRLFKTRPRIPGVYSNPAFIY